MARVGSPAIFLSCREGDTCDNRVSHVIKDFELITVDPAQMAGVPCVRHLRIPVATVPRLLAGGFAEAEIRSEYPDLEPEDIRGCLHLAAASAMEREIALMLSV